MYDIPKELKNKRQKIVFGDHCIVLGVFNWPVLVAGRTGDELAGLEPGPFRLMAEAETALSAAAAAASSDGLASRALVNAARFDTGAAGFCTDDCGCCAAAAATDGVCC